MSRSDPAGTVVKYYRAIGVASVKLTGTLRTGDRIRICGHTTDFEQIIDSMEINRQKVTRAEKGQLAGIRVTDFVRKNDVVYRLGDE